jgi:predicted N-formylglutamate amidohydrolase
MPQPTVLNPDATSRILLFVDHASSHVPEEFDSLGLREDALEEHIGWDIGTALLARALAKRLSLPTVLASVSRLVVDTNRDPSDAQAVPEYSDEILIPGNLGLPFQLRRERFERYHATFHDACERLIIEQLRRGAEPLLIGLHSFTPKMRRQEPRPWEVGVMWGHDDSLADPLIGFFKAKGLTVGENEPYSGQPPGAAFYTMARHGAVNRLPHTQIEICNDQIADPQGIAKWTEILIGAFRRLDGGVIDQAPEGEPDGRPEPEPY